jgi:hypothetical protein
VYTSDRSFDAAGWLADGTRNRGMPYAWGGFTSVDEFTAGLGKSRPAGLVPVSEGARGSRFAMGLDCSGYVSRCFDLPVKQTTRSLSLLCYQLDGFESLQPCDLLNKHDSHVVLFVDWVDDSRQQMRVLEAARLGVTESTYAVDAARRDGFLPLRYRLLDQRWQPMDAHALGKPRWLASTPPGPFVASRAPVEPDADGHPLARAAAGTWVRYSVTEAAGPAVATMRTMFVAAADNEAVDLQCTEVIDGKLLPTGRRSQRSQVAPAALIDMLAYYEPLSLESVVEHEVTAGACTLGGRKVAARTHRWRLRGTTVVRHQEYPLLLDVNAVFADDVPVYGLLSADFTLAIDWRRTGQFDAATAYRCRLSLHAFGSAP